MNNEEIESRLQELREELKNPRDYVEVVSMSERKARENVQTVNKTDSIFKTDTEETARIKGIPPDYYTTLRHYYVEKRIAL